MPSRQQLIRRISWLFLAFTLALAGLATRLYFIQIVQSERYAAAASSVYTKTIPGEQYPRGNILDRFGRTLTDRKERAGVAVIPAMAGDRQSVARQLDRVFGMPAGRFWPVGPFLLKTGLTAAETEAVTAARWPGIYLLSLDDRYGPGTLATHLTGYVSGIDGPTWETLRQQGRTADAAMPGEKKTYQRDDVIGVMGIESQYEQFLKGNETRFAYAVTVDARGNLIEGPGFARSAHPGGDPGRADVVLTINRDIQELVERAMDRQVPRGAVVVLDTTTGEVLAMASRPNYNQNTPAAALDPAEAADNSFLNRALAHYFPGSIFKTMVAAAALEEGLVAPDEKFYCSGAYVFPTGLTIPCWDRKGHGELTFEDAMAVSCNPTFIEVGLRLGREKLLDYAGRMGLNNETLIGYRLPPGPVPVTIDKYGPGKVANASLGQEGVRLTPLQVAELMGVVARGGLYLPSRIARQVVDGRGAVLESYSSPAPVRAISAETSAVLGQMLLAVTTRGTGKEAWVAGWGSAGKTSSAETGSVDQKGKAVTNAWFAGYTPVSSPRYALAVLVEGGPSGGRAAAPVFREIVEGIRRLPEPEQNLAPAQ